MMMMRMMGGGDLKEEIAACLCPQSELHGNVPPLYIETMQEN